MKNLISNNSNVHDNDLYNKTVYRGIKLIVLLHISMLLKPLKVNML